MVILTPAVDDATLENENGETKKTVTLQTENTTTSTTMDRRLVEYFVVVSSVPRKGEEENKEEAAPGGVRARGWSEVDVAVAGEISDEDNDDAFIDDNDFQPVITARYPLEDHEGNPLHENVTFFCHPQGAIRLRNECSMPKVHYFVATGGHGNQMYGTCLTLWEPYMITSSRSPSKRNLNTEAKSPSEKQKEVFLPKCLVILSSHPYLMAFREFLTQLNRLSKMEEMTLPIERYITNFCAEVPAPPPGSFEVQTTILDSVIKFWSPPHNQPIPWVSLPFSYLFQCLDIDNIIKVWHCLALEQQVLITSTQLSLLTNCTEVFLSLLFPMRWSHAYIPLLPHFLIPILSAPMPFLCGINKANLADALYDLSLECVVVDLDKNLVTMGPSTPALPPLPKAHARALKNKLEENVGMVFREARSLTKNDDFSDRGIHLPTHVKNMADGMWESRLCLYDEAFHLAFTPENERKNILNGNDTTSFGEDTNMKVHIMTTAERQKIRRQSEWDAVQEAFLETYVFLLKNYRKFLVYPAKGNEGSYGGAGFQSKEFVSSQRYDTQGFLKMLIGTQMFDAFVTKRLYGSGEADVTFFDMAIGRFLKNQGIVSSMRALKTGGTMLFGEEPLLQSALAKHNLKTIVPPEPSSDDLPPPPTDGGQVGTAVITAAPTKDTLTNGSGTFDKDDQSVGSDSTQSTRGTNRTGGTSRNNPGSPSKKTSYRSVQDKAEEILERHRGYRYTYPTFPSELDKDLFGTPRPMPSAVTAEFERQKKEGTRFRRKKSAEQRDANQQQKNLKANVDPDVLPSPEVSTFTLFFMAFSAMVGKDLLEISHNPLLHTNEREIFSTYTHPVSNNSAISDNETEPESSATNNQEDGENEEETFEDALSEEDIAAADDIVESGECTDNKEEKENENEATGNAEEISVKSVANSDQNKDTDATADTENTQLVENEEKRRRRFQDSLSAHQIEEAKATGRAQLGLAFEMLTMMKKRAIKTDPEAYQCLIDACGRVGDTKRATTLLAAMHEDGIVADGVVYSCLVSAFSAESAWKQVSGEKEEELPAWANSTAVEMDWNKLRAKKTFRENLRDRVNTLSGKSENDGDSDQFDGSSRYSRLRNMIAGNKGGNRSQTKAKGVEFFVTEAVERQIELGENLLEIVYPDISVDTDNETCPRCNFLLSDDDVVGGWTPNDSQDYTTSCPNCRQRFVPHFCVQSTSQTFLGSRGLASPLLCERLSPWVLQKEIRSVMSDREGVENLLSPEWREKQTKSAVLWWNLILSCMRYRFPFTFLLQGTFEQNLIAPMPEDIA